MGDQDELFSLKDSLSSFERVKALAKDTGTDWISLEGFEGVHEFSKSDEAIIKTVKHLEE